MSLQRHLPLYNFLRVLSENGGVDFMKMHHLAPWLLKLSIFWPLRQMEAIHYHQRISTTTIEKDPVFILGHYRSGTTYLQRLFAQDPQFGYQTVFHSALPEVMLGFQWFFKPLLGAITKVFRIENKFHDIPFRWDFPGEEDVALTSFCWKDAAHWGNLFPGNFQSYFERYVYFNGSDTEEETWKQNYLYFLKKLYLSNDRKQLVLKSPLNTARIPMLLELFPNAKFIHIHRDPFKVFASSRRFWQIVNQYYALKSIGEKETDQLILYSYKNLMQRYLDTKSIIPEGNLYELGYEQLRQSPIEQLNSMYDFLELKNFDGARKNMKSFLSASSNFRQRNYTLPSEVTNSIREAWSPFLELYGEKENSHAIAK